MAETSTGNGCGSVCTNCAKNDGLWLGQEPKSNSDILHLHQEIESLKRQLVEREYYVLQMETNMFKHAQKYPNGEWEHLKHELFTWKDKYERLYESYKKILKVNQNLEDKLLKLVDKYETEKASLNRDIADLTNRLVETRLSINDLEEQNELYKRDCNIAMRLLQCKPSNFISQKLSSFPSDLQDKVRLHFSQQPRSKELQNSCSTPELRTIRVSIPTFPPTAIVYSVPSSSESELCSDSASNTPDYVSAETIAKVLEERTKERTGGLKERCRACWFRRYSVECKDETTQTRWPASSMMCLCNGKTNCVRVPSRHRSGSSSSSDCSAPVNCLRTTCNGSMSTTETAI